MAHIHLVTDIAAPAAICFDAARDVTVHAESWPAHRAVGGVLAGPMELGEQVTWLSKHFGISWRMTSKIVAFERPDRFVDEMQRGPFHRWRHEHRFVSTSSGTRMIDNIEFASPLGPLGWLVDHLGLERYMTKLLRKHNEHVRLFAEQLARPSALGLAAAEDR